jgi:hypothetical protein
MSVVARINGEDVRLDGSNSSFKILRDTGLHPKRDLMTANSSRMASPAAIEVNLV